MTYKYEVMESLDFIPETPWAYVHTNATTGVQRVYVLNPNGRYFKVGFSESFTKTTLDSYPNTFPVYGKEAVILKVK